MNKIKIYKNFESIDNSIHRAVTVGAFDGVHLGHIAILEELKKRALENNLKTMVVTFSIHPQLVVGTRKGEALNLLSTMDEKIDELGKLSIDEVLFIHFNKSFSEIDSKTFIEEYLMKMLNAKVLVSGYDNKMGSDGAMADKSIKSQCKEDKLEFYKVEPVFIDDIAVSSTSVRKALQDGDYSRSYSFLGNRNYKISGIIAKGEGLGRKMGFPTANLLPFDSYKLIPKNGVYFTRVKMKDKYYFGMTNIGERPTVSDKGKITIETNIFDFDEDIYGDAMELEFISRLRDEKKFASIDDLINNINQDKEECIKLATK